MNYLIDANNLAGSLAILSEKEFDKILIGVIKEWLGEKQKTVVLVFDSLDAMGDRIDLGNIQVIYSPRDNYNKSADEKIVEIFRQWKNASRNNSERPEYTLNVIKKLAKDDLTFVSDDLDLRRKVLELKEGINEKVKIIRNDEFINLLEKKIEINEDEILDRGLSEDEVADINNELMNEWRD